MNEKDTDIENKVKTGTRKWIKRDWENHVKTEVRKGKGERDR
jgi:hypothetical protein